MGGTAKKSNYLSDFWNYQTALQHSSDIKKEVISVLRDQLLDPFSEESLSQYKQIDSFLEKKGLIHPSSKEQELNLFQDLAQEINKSTKTSLSLLKRNWDSVLLKRKILPKECFQNTKFQSEIYKNYLFKELCSKINKHHSILSLCYHFGSEFQETCAILNGNFLDLEWITLEFVLFAEHNQSSFKHPDLFIQDPVIISTSVKILEKNFNMSFDEHYNMLKRISEFTLKNNESSFLEKILNLIPIESEKSSEFDFFDSLEISQKLSFCFYFDNLFKIFKNNKSKILDLSLHYLESIEKKQLFFESDFFFEIPLIVDTLLIIVSDLSYEDQKSTILKLISKIINALDCDNNFFIKILKKEITSHQDEEILSIIYPLFDSEIPDIREVVNFLSIFRSFKALTQKKDFLKPLYLLSKERLLSPSRVSGEFTNLSHLKEIKQFIDQFSKPKEKITQLLVSYQKNVDLDQHINEFYSFFA